MFIAWTTLATRADAEKLAAEVVSLGLAACVQVEGPIVSFYTWQGRPERTEEFRLCLKCLPDKLPALETHVLGHHPYDTPEFVVVPLAAGNRKYLAWLAASGGHSR